jgi:hypothetical protein
MDKYYVQQTYGGNWISWKIYRIDYSPSRQAHHMLQSVHLMKNHRNKASDTDGNFENLVLEIKFPTLSSQFRYQS